MRRIFLGLICLVVLLLASACVMTKTIVVPGGPVVGTNVPNVPPEFQILIVNKSARRWIKIEGLVGMLGTDILVVGPQRSITLAVRRHGRYGGTVKAYQRVQGDGQGGIELLGFISEKEFTFVIDGGDQEYEGGHYGRVEEFNDGDFRYDIHQPFSSVGIGGLIRFKIEN